MTQVQMKKGVVVSNAKGGLFEITTFKTVGRLGCTIHPIDKFSQKQINTGGGYLCLSYEHLTNRFFIVVA